MTTSAEVNCLSLLSAEERLARVALKSERNGTSSEVLSETKALRERCCVTKCHVPFNKLLVSGPPLGIIGLPFQTSKIANGPSNPPLT